ncbi:programmed cell death protein 2-like isoform X1 [Branchiostoma floridae]|uniref:Programmed cell death protein 2-like isoform X1 n=1 Tax=Branchiostoma floridae TaxID=7739 RepID=A0A9J7M6S6_BRAFL|nr:programmed cell death protein 2-like isoform X1 [Branchiostoma floridae]
MAAPALLGVLDEPVRDERDISSLFTNRVGGKPGCAPLPTFPAMPMCTLCGGRLTLVVQVYCPLDGSPYHRTLYVFACCRKQCWNKSESWFAVRLQVPCEDPSSQHGETEAEVVSMATTDWCDDADDWGDEEEEDAVTITTYTTMIEKPRQKDNNVTYESVCTEQFQNLDISDPPELTGFNDENSIMNEDKPEEGIANIEKVENVVAEDLPVEDIATSSISKLLSLSADTEEPSQGEIVFEAYYISVFEEPTNLMVDCDDHVKRLMTDYQQKEGVNLSAMEDSVTSAGKKGGGESYEKSTARHGDKIFQKFAKRVSLCPEQILRYNRNGKPLYIQDPEETLMMPPPCSNCGGQRDFELQLMPTMISILSTQGANSSDPMLEFGTVLVYTCVRSCWTQQSVSCVEHVVVQADPYNQFFMQRTEN